MKSFFKAENVVWLLFFIVSSVLITVSTHREKVLVESVTKTVMVVQLRIGQMIKSGSDFFSSFGDLIGVRQRYQLLEDEMVYYRGIDRENMTLKNENMRLRALLAMTPRISYRYQSANIVARSPDNFQSAIVLDKGRTNGIVKNMSVIAYSTRESLFAVIGRISEVYEHSSRVQPIFDPSQHVSGRLQNSRFLGLVSGEGRENFASFNYLDLAAKSEISEGDLVVTSGLNMVGRDGVEYQSHYPEGLYIGRIEKPKNLKTINTSLSLQLKSILHTDQIENVFIITEQRSYNPLTDFYEQ